MYKSSSAAEISNTINSSILNHSFNAPLTLKSCGANESKQSELKTQPQGKFFFTLTLWSSTFCNSFELIQRAFHGGGTTVLEIPSQKN